MCRAQESLQDGILVELQTATVSDWTRRGMHDDLPDGYSPIHVRCIRISVHRKPPEQGVRDCVGARVQHQLRDGAKDELQD